MRLSIILAMTSLASPALADPESEHPAVAEILGMPSAEVRSEVLTERMLAASEVQAERERWGAAMIVVRELPDASEASLRAYLTWALSDDDADRERAIEGARAGGRLDAQGVPVVRRAGIPTGEHVLGAPGPDHPQYGRYQRYQAERFVLACPSTSYEGLQNTFGSGDPRGFPAWVFVRGSGEVIVGWNVKMALGEGGVSVARDDECDPRQALAKCNPVEQARTLAQQHNEQLRERLGLHEDQVASLSFEPSEDLGRCGSWGRSKPKKYKTRKAPRNMGEEPPG